MEHYLPVIWAGVIGLAVVFYVLTDGFDLGIGILFPFTRTERQRDVMMNSVAPFWDGLMLLALIFRGVAFEFRWVAKPNHRLWDLAFIGGSTVAAFAQGLVLGGIVQGIDVQNGQYAGGAFDWFSPFSVLCGVALVFGYALLGAGWLMMKTEGEVAERARKQASMLLPAVLVFMAIVSIWTPLADRLIFERWFGDWNFLYLSPVPVLTGVLALLAMRGIHRGQSVTPFLASVGLFVLGFVGLAISWFPYLVPPSLTVWQTAAAPASQIFLLLGATALLPLILVYNVFLHWVFRGKIVEGQGYH
jgi:cytochrome bd ubiquinol oxidase subunit II